jgi:multiple sugar transport system substrate-binding protein
VKQAGGDPDHFTSDWDGMIKLAQKINALGGDIRGMTYSVGSDREQLALAGGHPRARWLNGLGG